MRSASLSFISIRRRTSSADSASTCAKGKYQTNCIGNQQLFMLIRRRTSSADSASTVQRKVSDEIH